MGNLDKAHHILRWNFKLKASKLCNFNQKEVKCFNLGDYNKMNDFFSNIDWASELNKVDVDQSYEIFLKHYRRACDMFIPIKKLAPAVSNPKWLNKIIKQKAKSKNKMWFRLRASGYENKSLLDEYNKCKIELKKVIKDSIWNFEKDLVFRAKSNPKILFSYIKNKQHVKQA